MNAGLLSHIRLLSYNLIYPYEWVPTGAPQSTEDPSLSSVVKHPFPVMHVKQGRYLLLDGAALFRRMADIGLAHVPVQICPRSRLTVSSDQIGLVGITATDLDDMAHHFTDQIVAAKLGQQPPPGYLVVNFLFEKGEVRKLFLRQTNCSGCPEAVQHLFRAIEEHGRYLPAASGTRQAGALCKTATLSGTVRLPEFTVDDVAGAVPSGRLFPPHVIRVVSSSRVFSIDFPLSVLRSSISVEEKEAFLRDLIAYREQTHKTAFFKGQVYFLNS